MQNFGFPVKDEFLDGEGVDVRLEGAQEGGEVQEGRLNKFYHLKKKNPHYHSLH